MLYGLFAISTVFLSRRRILCGRQILLSLHSELIIYLVNPNAFALMKEFGDEIEKFCCPVGCDDIFSLFIETYVAACDNDLVMVMSAWWNDLFSFRSRFCIFPYSPTVGGHTVRRKFSFASMYVVPQFFACERTTCGSVRSVDHETIGELSDECGARRGETNFFFLSLSALCSAVPVALSDRTLAY